MEKITLYEAIVEFEHRSICQEKESETSWWSIGLFEKAQDAKYAIQIYEKAQSIKRDKCTGNHYVTGNTYPKHLNLRYYKNLDEFINNNVPVMEYVAFIGQDGLDKLLKEIVVETENKFKKQQDRKEFNSIIERMIRHYKYTLKIDEATGTDEKTIEEYKENIQLLEDLRDGKIELK